MMLMVGIIRNANITFASKKELDAFDGRISKQTPGVSVKELRKEVHDEWHKNHAW